MTRSAKRFQNVADLRVTINARPHDFRLTRERVDLPEVGVVDYWNMDGADLRRRHGGRNGPAVVESWLDAMHEEYGAPDDLDRQHYVLARAHLRIAHAHSH